jgi:hypothetical protein
VSVWQRPSPVAVFPTFIRLVHTSAAVVDVVGCSRLLGVQVQGLHVLVDRHPPSGLTIDPLDIPVSHCARGVP